VLAVSLQPTQAESGTAAQEMLSLTAENIKKGMLTADRRHIGFIQA
jgi:hypothetical protein